jgi:hypothetical protein
MVQLRLATAVDQLLVSASTVDVGAACERHARHARLRFWQAHRAFAAPRWQTLYRRWLTDGDAVFELISSRLIADALDRGTARIDRMSCCARTIICPPWCSLDRSAPKGVEERATASTQSQPSPSPPLSISE